MRIGFDFDNTIISYDAIFHKVASEQGLLDESVAVNKLAVRDFLRAKDKEDLWTEMQGYVYGERITEAEIFPDVIKVMQHLSDAGHSLAIVSHKTRHPYRGQQYDLHSAARNWINTQLGENTLIPANQIFFELSKEEKLARIANFGCDVFIDDLPEILLAPDFPLATQRFLFDPEQHHVKMSLPDVRTISSWADFEKYLL